MKVSELYPAETLTRSRRNLDGLWGFQFDPQSIGKQEGWENRLPSPISMPVPASFSDLSTNPQFRDYCGDFWYETDFFVQKADVENRRSVLRFGSITHRAEVYVNGTLVTKHEGGFLPVICDVTGRLHADKANHIAVLVNNELNEVSLPCGTVEIKKDGRKYARPYFDFFNYSGIQRSVYLQSLPMESIQDYSTSYRLCGKDAEINYSVVTDGDHEVIVSLYDKGTLVTQSTGKTGTMHVCNAHLWNVRNAYLYDIVIQIRDTDTLIDEYRDRIGIRTVRIEGTRILINDRPVYLKGYGRHEDFDVIGKQFNYAVAKRDFELMKWNGANCFRTSHYPYDEGWYRMADEEGFLIIDEIAAVGMMRSTHNFVAAGMGQYTKFFETPTVPQLLANHLTQVEEMITRDKNHPSVFAWSLFNEPETTSAESHEYFSRVFDFAKELDPQKRPRTGAFEKNSSPEKCQCWMLCDFICLNRYYGWYISGGDLEMAEDKFRDEMNRWEAKNPGVPFVFTEFGTDTLGEMHELPGKMWSQEYQKEYYEMNFRVMDSYDWIQGELVWNFADFATSEGIFRVGGNRKGVFTRNRQPKDSAFLLKERWEKKNKKEI